MTKQITRFDQIANTTNANLTTVLQTISDRANLGSNTTDVYANGTIVGTAQSINFINTSSVTISSLTSPKGDGNVNVAFTTTIPGVIVQIACSDLLTDLATAYTGALPANIAYFRVPRAFTLTTLRASLGNAATTGGAANSCNIQIFMNGANVLTTPGGKLQFNQSANTTVGATNPYVIANGAFVDDGLVAIQLSNIGTGANGLIVTFIGA